MDDGSQPPISQALRGGLGAVRLLRSGGIGPARARNLGWRAAFGHLVLFTDDDVDVAPGWLESALDVLQADPGLMGVEGVVESPPWDRLTQYSVERDGPGWGLTCNVAYRRDVLERVGGFHEGFPHPHGEDVDLYLRIRRIGRIGFSHAMRVTHPPRRMRVSDYVRCGRWISSDLLLHARHPDLDWGPRPLPAILVPLANVVVHWLSLGRGEGFGLLRSPRRMAFWATAASGHVAAAALETVRNLPRCARR